MLSLFPYVGLTLGTIPLLLLTLGFRSLFAAIVLLVIVVALQLADSMVLRPRMAAHSIHVGLAVPWVVALLGYSIYGIGGAAYAVAYALFGMALLDRIEAADRTDAGAPAPLDGLAATQRSKLALHEGPQPPLVHREQGLGQELHPIDERIGVSQRLDGGAEGGAVLPVPRPPPARRSTR